MAEEHAAELEEILAREAEAVERAAGPDATLPQLTPMFLQWMDGKLLCLECTRRSLRDRAPQEGVLEGQE